MPPSYGHSFIFLDPKGKRWPRLRLCIILSLLLLFLTLVIFIRSLLVLPRLQRLDKVGDLSQNLKSLIKSEEAPYQPEPLPAWLQNKPAARPEMPLHKKDPQAVRLGFSTKGDRNSYRSIAHHTGILTHLAPEWFSVGSMPPRLFSRADRRAARLAEEHGLQLLPLLTNLRGSMWQPEAVETLLRAGRIEQEEFFAKLIRQLLATKAAGVVVDFEQVDWIYRDQLSTFIANMKNALKLKNLELWLCVPMGNDIKVFDLAALSGVVDRFVAMIYFETGEDDPPGPLASLPWFREWLRVLTEQQNPAQWIISLGAFAYDWPEGEHAQTISFADAMSRANIAGQGAVENNLPYNAPHFAYADNGRPHAVWFLDAITFYNQKREAELRQTGGIAVWRLGLEDPEIWETFRCGKECRPEQFAHVRSRAVISEIGEGDFITARTERSDGERLVSLNADGSWHTKYLRYPQYPLLYHQGQSDPHRVALTFDDGPDPDWTPQVLDILREKDVKAAFFVTGANAASNPALMRRIFAEGHEIGNHTYSHANLAGISAPRLQLELNATQRVIESLTSRSTTLFRPPYNADRHPQSLAEFVPLAAAQQLGYLPVSESIDTEDWRLSPPQVLLKRVRERRGEGNIVLLHDGGGDRSQTVAALPLIIDYLQKRGDRIVSLSALLGVPANSLMPPIPADDARDSRIVATTGFHVLNIAEELILAFMIASTGILLLRTLCVLVLALRHKRTDFPPQEPDGAAAPVSVLITAYNEAKVIRSTLGALLKSDYPGQLEILVVDDGSKDDTAQFIEEIAARDSRVRLIRQENCGKAVALSTALRESAHEFIVMLDADTVFAPGTISHLIRQLSQQNTGAVSGQAKVGNQDSLLGRFQSLEYVCGFNLDRRAYDVWNCISVVPGAVCAMRRTAIIRAGGIPRDTLAEDTDLTLSMHRLGYDVHYASHAVAWTEAPETVRALVRQRTRWAFGTMQCLWKHRDLLFNPAFGAIAFFSLPSMWFCHLFLVALIPLVDLLLVVSLATGMGMAIIDYALVFLVLDLSSAFCACLMEREKLLSAMRIIPMRLLYRPILSFAVWSAIFRAMRGAWVGWGRQERKGLVLPHWLEIQSTGL